MKTYKKAFIALTIILGLYVLIGAVWQGLELSFYHQIKPSPEDSIIGMILAVSLYYNLHIQIH